MGIGFCYLETLIISLLCISNAGKARTYCPNKSKQYFWIQQASMVCCSTNGPVNAACIQVKALTVVLYIEEFINATIFSFPCSKGCVQAKFK